MTGGRVAHPLLISMANIFMDFRNKASNHCYLLLALLPVPAFICSNTKICGILEARLVHKCLDEILQPLKDAARFGISMTDPLGTKRFCFTPLASCIVDTPESAMIACVGGLTSSVTLASYHNFGDAFRHPPRRAKHTLQAIKSIEPVGPWNLEQYEKAAKKIRLNGVHLPFWRDWALADPSVFLTSEPLHHWHKQFWDHDAKWCIYAVGSKGIDFRFSILQPRTGFRHFHTGISTLKQVTGREHRDIQHYIVPVIADAVSPGFLVAIRALLDFRYLAQATVISETTCNEIERALALFHEHKQSILDAEARRGSNGPIDHFRIPKLEFLQSVAYSMRFNGAACQWSADTTEHAHIEVVKDPIDSGNNQGYEAQICRYLDRLDKVANFDLATNIQTAGIHFGRSRTSDSENNATPSIGTTSELLSIITAVGYKQSGPSRQITDYFYRADLLCRNMLATSTVHPHRTFRSSPNIVLHLSRDPALKRQPIDDAANTFKISDLRPAIADFITRLQSASADQSGHINVVGGRRIAQKDCPLPVEDLEVWTKMRLQTNSYHPPHDRLPPITINATPPSQLWPHGHFDPVVVNVDPSQTWPNSGLSGWYSVIQVLRHLLQTCSGHIVANLRVIFHIFDTTTLPCTTPLGKKISGRVLAYIQRYDIVPQCNPANPSLRGSYPEQTTGLYLLKKATRSSGEPLGDVVPLDQIRAFVDVVPRFEQRANPQFTKESSVAESKEFWLNRYFNKELFWALCT